MQLQTCTRLLMLLGQYGNLNTHRTSITQLTSLRQFVPHLAKLPAVHTLRRGGRINRHRSGTTLRHSCTARLNQPSLADLPSIGLNEPARLAVFVSGGGSNFRAIHDGILRGAINAEIAAVISDVPGCGAWQYARQANIPAFCYPQPIKLNPNWPIDAPSPLTTADLIHTLKHALGVHFVVLAGYLKLVPAALVREYKNAMLNIHPGLLPAFGGKGLYGMRVHKAVIASGARWSGATVHFVDEEYDTGPILAQAIVPVSPHDSPQSLAARVLEQEHQVYPKAVAALVDNRITWREDGIPILWTPH